jgi:RNA polymerase sigma factor (sigma-70 family)
MPHFNVDQEWDYYYPKIYGYFYRRLNNRIDVEDLTSVTLTQFFQVMLDEEKSRKIEDPLAYAWKIAHNQLVYFIKTKSTQKVTVGLVDELFSIDDDFERLESENFRLRKEQLMGCVQKTLTGQDYQIVIMSVIEDRKSAEVGDALELSSDTVRQRLVRALKKLREHCRQIWDK